MTAPEIKDADGGDEGDDGCGACLPCRFRMVVQDMEIALDMLRGRRRKEAEGFLCAAIEDAKTGFEEWADEAGYGDEGDIRGDVDEADGEGDLASMPAAGRA